MEVSINVDIYPSIIFLWMDFPSKTIHYVDPPFMENPRWKNTLPPSDASRQVLRRPCGFPQCGYCAMVVLVSRDFKRYTLIMGSSYITLILGKLLDMDLAGFHRGLLLWMGPLKNSRVFEIDKMPTAKVHPVCCFQPGSEPFEKKYMDLQHAICRSGKTFCPKKIGFHLWYTGRKCSLRFFLLHHLFQWLLHPALSRCRWH